MGYHCTSEIEDSGSACTVGLGTGQFFRYDIRIDTY